MTHLENEYVLNGMIDFDKSRSFNGEILDLNLYIFFVKRPCIIRTFQCSIISGYYPYKLKYNIDKNLIN